MGPARSDRLLSLFGGCESGQHQSGGDAGGVSGDHIKIEPIANHEGFAG